MATTQKKLTTDQYVSAYSDLATGVFQGIGAYFGAQEQQNNLDVQAQIAAMNAAYARHMAHLTMETGAQSVQQLFQHTRALKGAQKVDFAASGISLKSPDAKAVIASTVTMGHTDAQRLLQSTYERAYAQLMQASNYDARSSAFRSGASAINPFMAGFPSIATSSSKFAAALYPPGS